MNLYIISYDSQNIENKYDAALVAADSPEEARQMDPSGDTLYYNFSKRRLWNVWAPSIYEVKVQLVGTAEPGTRPGRLLSSFNAT